MKKSIFRFRRVFFHRISNFLTNGFQKNLILEKSHTQQNVTFQIAYHILDRKIPILDQISRFRITILNDFFLNFDFMTCVCWSKCIFS